MTDCLPAISNACPPFTKQFESMKIEQQREAHPNLVEQTPVQIYRSSQRPSQHSQQATHLQTRQQRFFPKSRTHPRATEQIDRCSISRPPRSNKDKHDPTEQIHHRRMGRTAMRPGGNSKPNKAVVHHFFGQASSGRSKQGSSGLPKSKQQLHGQQTQIVRGKEGHTTGSVASSYSPAMAEDCPPIVNLENLQLASSHRPINRKHQTSDQQATPRTATRSRRIHPSNPAHLPPNFSATTTSEHGIPSACSGVILKGCDLSRRTLSIRLCKRLYAI
ncbi:hypothetical protein ACLOJK_006554 [Asimina triloba]